METSTSVSAAVTDITTATAVAGIHQQVDKAEGFLNKALGYFKELLPLLIVAAVIILIGYVMIKLISKFIERALKRSRIDNAARNFLLSVIRVVLYAVVLIMALSVLNVPVSSIITILGAAGLAVSLALQTCLSNLAGGFIILFSKPFSSGDTVEIDGTVGTVQSISILYTKIYTFDGKTVFIPNGKVSDAKLINYTETPSRRIDLTFSISYNADYEKARALICGVINENAHTLNAPEPIVRMSRHGESSIEIDVLVWVANNDYFTTRYEMIESVKAAFDANNIAIPYGQLDVHIIK